MDRRKHKQFQVSHKGFTLVELIVVLVIVAVLAAIAIPAFLGFIDHAKDKKIIAHGQTSLSATQAALSDIYSSSDNRFTKEKRAAAREKAGVGIDTAFTVWNVRTLYDERVDDEPATVAITEEIGAYTVGKAIYQEGEDKFAAYDGKDWEIFDSYEATKKTKHT